MQRCTLVVWQVAVAHRRPLWEHCDHSQQAVGIRAFDGDQSRREHLVEGIWGFLMGLQGLRGGFARLAWMVARLGG